MPSCNRDGKIQGSILSSGWDTDAHTFMAKSSPRTLRHEFSFHSLRILQLEKLHAQTGKNVRENFFFSMCFAFSLYSATFFLLIIRIYLKIKSRICIKETHWNNDNGPFEKHWTYAWIEIMWVNKIWVLSLFIKMALSSTSFGWKRVLIFFWVSSLWFWKRKEDFCPGGVFQKTKRNWSKG